MFNESEQIILRSAGTPLLAVGFALLAGALLIVDPAASDAHIGAGYLTLTGLPLGTLGLTFVVIQAARGARLRHNTRIRRTSWLPRPNGGRRSPSEPC
jgi:hypothetical protein